jgi:hypothetical protein
MSWERNHDEITTLVVRKEKQRLGIVRISKECIAGLVPLSFCHDVY